LRKKKKIEFALLSGDEAPQAGGEGLARPCALQAKNPNTDGLK
jgi:hypothetical protein